MATITASIERSLQNCSLNQTTRTRPGGGDGGVGWSSSSSSSSSSSDSPESIINHQINTNNSKNNNRRSSTKKEEISRQQSNVYSSDDNSTFVELNSHVSLPYHWEQCLDLKTGEIYYINWSNGMKAKEDPRTTATGYNGDYFSEDEDDDDDDNDDDDDEDESNCYDSESSSTELSPCWNNRKEYNLKSMMKHHQQQELNQDSVLVVAGCKGCLMYYMVPKQVEDCPKCSGQLLHFAANNSSP